MSDENQQVAEEVVESEIDLSPSKDNPEDSNLKPAKIIPKKNVAELTDEDKTTIIARYQNVINQPFYQVKQFKNGKFRILRKKDSQPTVAQKVVNNAPVSATKAEKMVFYSDNQFLFEHIIELNVKVDRLMTKHKKLKKSYQTLQNDIYVDYDSETDIEPQIVQTMPDIAPVKQPNQNVYPQTVKKGEAKYLSSKNRVENSSIHSNSHEKHKQYRVGQGGAPYLKAIFLC